MSAASPAHAGTKAFVAVDRIQALPAHAVAGKTYRLHGRVSNAGARSASGRVTLRLLHRYRTPRVLARVTLRVRAHASRRFMVSVRVPAALQKGSYQLAACAPRGIGGNLTCATGATDLQVAGGDAIRGPAAAKQVAVSAQQDDTCSSGKHSIAPFGDVVYPEGGNGGYKSVHTDTNLIYDAPSNLFLAGTHVDQTIQATQCLTDFSFDFETQAVQFPNTGSATELDPNMTVSAVKINGQDVAWKFVQPTYPGDPLGDDDPDPRAHRTGQTNPIGGPNNNPFPPACASTAAPADNPAAQDIPCAANKLVVTPAAPVPSGQLVTVQIFYSGRPGVHSDGDGTTEGWFRSVNPVDDGGFVTTEPMGTEDWMPLNDHPTGKPTYDFTTITNIDRTAISNGELVSHDTNPADPMFPGAPVNGTHPAQPAGSVTWKWHMPNPVQDYLVENSVGKYSNGYDDGVHGGVKIGADGTLFYEFQSAGVAANRVASNKATMDRQEDITTFQKIFNGPFPFTSDGVIIGTPPASFEEEMETKITFAGGSISLGTFNHENMHQWWGDNVAASLTRFTFLKEGMANLGEKLNTARTAATNAGGFGTPAGNAAFDASMVSQFNSQYNTTSSTFWTAAPSNPTPDSLFNTPQTYSRPGTSYVALRQILGSDRWIQTIQGIQHDFGGGNISEAQMEAAYHKGLPNQSAACSAKLDQFFTQWWDTSYPAGGGVNKPQITGPGLAGPGFYDATGACSVQNPVLATPAISGPKVGDTYGGAARPVLTFAAPDGVTTQYNLDGAGFVNYAGPVTLADGAHTLVYRSIDASGNQTQDTTATPFKVDDTAPVTTATVAGGTPIAGGYVQVPDKAVVTLAAADAMNPVSKIEYSVDGGAFQTYTAPFTVNGSSLHVVQYRATDSIGNVEATKTLNVIIDPTASGGPTGTVPATLSLSLGVPAAFQPFQAGVGRDYLASTTATVLSTAGDAALSVSDPSTNATGRLVNGAFSLAAPLQLSATSAGGTGSAFAPLSTTAGSPLTLLTYTGPISNDPVTINLRQTIGQNEALRTGTYAKTLTFTLSTTTP